MAGIYVPGILFSFVDVVVTKRQTLAECWAVYWRAMKCYGSLYVAGMIFFLLVSFAMIEVPARAPTVFELCKDLVLYFLLGDFVSYFWHRFEHTQRWYMKNVHFYHHVDTPPLSICDRAFGTFQRVP